MSNYAGIPDGSTDFSDWGLVEFTGPFKALVLSDLHIPYHDRRSVIASIEYGLHRGANMILLNGDIIDFHQLSYWQKDRTKRRPVEEVKIVKKLIQELRNLFPKADIIYKPGNHEERWPRYIMEKVPELHEFPEFSLNKILGIPDKDWVGDCQPIGLGDLTVLHGHEYRFAVSNPVNPARGLFLRSKGMSMCGHFHQSSQHTERTVRGHNIATWSTGCLCDLHPAYRPLNNWNHGFAFVTVSSSGKFEVENKYISDTGKIY